MNNKLTVLSLVSFLFLFGCKGEKGETGARGPAGNTFELVTGSVPNNAFAVTDNRFINVSQMSVYVGDGTSLSELPYYLPASGVNAYCLYKPATHSVEIYNAQLAGATIYVIAVSL